MARRVHLFVTGRVQGVWFRQGTEQRARELGVTGWVRNLPDGRVEAVAEGEAMAVSQLVDYCRQGPPLARVDQLAVEDEPATGEFAGFEARR